jgi:hypothetical protein
MRLTLKPNWKIDWLLVGSALLVTVSITGMAFLMLWR